MAVDKGVPLCTAFLVAGALFFQSMVLINNLKTAQMFHTLAASSDGWSNVGTKISSVMKTELMPALAKVSAGLSTALETSVKIDHGVDLMMSLVGADADEALKSYAGVKPAHIDRAAAKANITKRAERLGQKVMSKVSDQVDEFMSAMRPALDQLRAWLEQFGDRLERELNDFGSSLDRVQKLLDEVMHFRGGGGGNLSDMVRYTFPLMNVDGSKHIEVLDIQQTAQQYGITALSGEKAQQLLMKYDVNGNKYLTKPEYTDMVQDPSLPDILSVILRTFAQKVATASSQLGSVKMRDEVATSFVDYLVLACARKSPQTTWFAEAMTNTSLPIQFTVAVFYELVKKSEDPDRLSFADVGGMLLKDMVANNASSVVEALALMSSPEHWDFEGFDVASQPAYVRQVTTWIVEANGTEAIQQGLGSFLNSSLGLPEALFKLTEARRLKYSKQSSQQAAEAEQLFRTNGAQVLRNALLGTVTKSQTASKGQPARPETLNFAKWVMANGTRRSQKMLKACFLWDKKSSGTLDSVGTGLGSMIRKVQQVLRMMERYATADGIARLERQARNFVNQSMADVMVVVSSYADAQLDALLCRRADGNPEMQCKAALSNDHLLVDLSGGFAFLFDTMNAMRHVFPGVISSITFARKEVSSVAGFLQTTMEVLGNEAPPLLKSIGQLYKTLWTVYYVVYFLLTAGVLFYGFWANGFFNGPKESAPEEPAPDRSMAGQARTCFRSCNACLVGCHDHHIVFWSVILIMQILCLVSFLVAALVCIVQAVQAFLSNGCSKIYILGDISVCNTALGTVAKMLPGFGTSTPECGENHLATCEVILSTFKNSFMTTATCAVLAAVLSYQLIVESAMLHERSRWRRAWEQAQKENE